MIELEDIEFRWRKDGPLLLNIPRLSIPAGARVFLQGPSGSGKTSLLNLLAGVTLPQKGRLEILGQEIPHLSSAKRDRFRADHMGLIFQIFNLLPYLNVLDNVCLPLQFSRRRRQRALDRAGTARRAAEELLTALNIPDSHFTGHAVSELSTGQQQRVAVARALIGEPEIILADEPTSALDNENGALFLDLLFSELAQRQATLLFVSHDERMAGRFQQHLSLAALQRRGGDPS